MHKHVVKIAGEYHTSSMMIQLDLFILFSIAL